MSRAATLAALGYGVYLLHTFWTGALYFYIHPLYVIPTVVAGLVLLALGAVAFSSTSTPHAEPASGLRLAVLAVPLALGFLLPAQPLSPLSADQRGFELGAPGAVEPEPGFDVRVPPEEYTIKDWVKALYADPEPSRHAGKPVRVTGFVHRDERLPEDWFVVGRFVLKCCAVDAQPIGLPVRAPGAIPERGTWVVVEGAWDVAMLAGDRRAVVAAATITPTARPSQPYLY